jgi:hypothetical protein
MESRAVGGGLSAPAHAKLSASGSEKWLTCTPSARFEEHFPDEQSAYAAEGTFAHAVFENELRLWLGHIRDDDHAQNLAVLRRNPMWSEDLKGYVDAALVVALERIDDAKAACKDPVVLVEQRLDFSPWVPEGFGTGDLVIVTDDAIEVLDLKYGKGVPVSAQGNSQMRLYGLGAYNELAHLYAADRVRMTVLQPRLENYSTEEISVADLLDWAANEVVPRAQLAWAGEGEFVAGDHCTSCFCKARFTCAARAQANLQLAKAEFALVKPDEMTQEQIVQVLERGPAVAAWIADVQAHALSQATKHGAAWPGFKLVAGRSVRKYSNHDAVADKLREAGVEEALIYERSLRGITAMETLLGKKRFNQLLGDLISKPEGKPTLVPEGDKRLAINSVLADFS